MSYKFDDYEQEENYNSNGLETEVKEVENKKLLGFNFNIDVDRISNDVYNAVVSRIENEIIKKITENVIGKVQIEISEAINERINASVEDAINKIYSNEKLTIAEKESSYWNDTIKTKEIVFKDYLMEKLKVILESGEFKTYNYRGDSEKTTISNYFKDKCIDKDIKEQLDRVIKELKGTISNNIKEMFDNSTKQLLSEQVMQVLISSDTYKKITDNIKSLSNPK